MKRRLLERIHGQIGRIVPGTPIWDFEWDICCILDACRADSLQQVYTDADDYWSIASTSKYWLQRTFDGQDFKEVGYISANPFAAELDPNAFGYFHLEPVAKTAHGIETVEPQTLRDRAISVWHNRDEIGIEKLVVHYMQPHVPFRSKPEWFNQLIGSKTWGSHLANQVADGEIRREDWIDAYQDNLDWVLEDGIRPLATRVDGTIGVTADHGNALGEWGLYGHPKGVAVPAVREVPWYSIEGENRDRAKAQHETGATLTEEQRLDQLKALGYR